MNIILNKLRRINSGIHNNESTNIFSKFVLFFLKKQIIRFCVVGVIGVSFNYSLFLFFYRFLSINYMIASAIGYISAIFLAYFLNMTFTFGQESKDKNLESVLLIKYFVLNICSLCLGLVFLKVLVEIVGITPYIANFFNIGLTATTNYLGSKIFVFKENVNG